MTAQHKPVDFHLQRAPAKPYAIKRMSDNEALDLMQRVKTEIDRGEKDYAVRLLEEVIEAMKRRTGT